MSQKKKQTCLRGTAVKGQRRVRSLAWGKRGRVKTKD